MSLGFGLGELTDLESVKTALRDMEAYLKQLIPDAAPTGDAQVLMRDPEGNIRQYTLTGTGGSSVTINETNRTIVVNS